MTRILLVDDAPEFRLVYERFLTGKGFRVDAVEDGGEALLLLGPGHAYDLVISDLHMPGIDGCGLVHTLRETPWLRMLPVLMLTGSTARQDLVENMDAGVSAYVRKSCDPVELLAHIRNLLKMKSLQDEIERVARTDSLTGLWNRRHGAERLLEELSRGERYARPLSVALVDIDHFKRVNDTWGHQAGDEVLVAVAAELRSVSRQSDVVMRWGGEEFLFVFPETDLAEAAAIVERFRRTLQDNALRISAGGGRDLSVTVSGGVAEREREDTLESLVERADAALYRAKAEGRNRLLVAEGGALRPL